MPFFRIHYLLVIFCRHIFLFDVAAIVCKRRGDNYEMKDVLDLNVFKITDNPTSDREAKKVENTSMTRNKYVRMRNTGLFSASSNILVFQAPFKHHTQFLQLFSALWKRLQARTC